MSSEIDDKEKELIQKQAKLILDRFAKALERVQVHSSSVERPEDRRQEGSGKNPDPKFKEIMMKNAPHVKEDCIEAERGSWT